MESFIVDYSDPAQALELEVGYFELWTEDLKCVEERNTPPMDIIESGKYTAVMCKEGDELLGILVFDRQGSILYPVLKRDYELVLESLCEAAYEARDGKGIHADTDNELILQTAENFTRRPATRTGTHLEWK